MRTTLLLIVSVFALGIGVAAVAAGEKNGWFIVAFGTLCTPFLCLLLLRPNRLELDERVLTTIGPLGKRWSVEWRQCGPFRTAIPNLDRSMVSGGSASLPDTYGMSAAELAALLNRHRDAAREDAPGG